MLNLKCRTKCWLDKTKDKIEQYTQVQGKINMIKLMIKCSLPSLNVKSFFGFSSWKVVEAWSKMLKHSSHYRVTLLGISLMSENVRGPNIDQVLTHTCG